MNKENVTKWIAALRSGEYKQTRYRLRGLDENRETAFCCLGVAAAVAGFPFEKERENGEMRVYDPYLEVKAWLGLDDSRPYVLLNDRDHFPFSAIADYAEAHLLREGEKKPA